MARPNRFKIQQKYTANIQDMVFYKKYCFGRAWFESVFPLVYVRVILSLFLNWSWRAMCSLALIAFLCRVYVIMVSLYFLVSVANNYALNFNLPLPLHMIFRSVSIRSRCYASDYFLSRCILFSSLCRCPWWYCPASVGKFKSCRLDINDKFKPTV